MITMIKEQVKELIAGFWNYRNLTYTERQVFIRKVFTVPFLVLFPLFLTAGLLSRALRLLSASFSEYGYAPRASKRRSGNARD